MTAGAYYNPFLGPATKGRIDQGVDYSLSPGEKITAIGDAIIRGILPNWYQGQPLLWYQLTSGPDAGKYVYIAEQITPTVKPGARVAGGQTIATYASSGTGIETGWATSTGATLAHVTGGYTEGHPTSAGNSFAKFLEGLPLSKEQQQWQALKSNKGFQESAHENVEGGLGAVVPGANIAQELVNDLIGWAGPSALKFLLYTVFILGGVALAGYGLATMLKPTPPKLSGGLKKVAKTAAVAAAA